MSNYTHTLTPLEIACGVTLEDVQRELPRGLFMDNGSRFIVSGDCSPAIGSSVARCAFTGAPPEYLGQNQLGDRVYRIAR